MTRTIALTRHASQSNLMTPLKAHHDPFMLDDTGVQTTSPGGSGPRGERAQQQDKLTMAAIRISIKEGIETNKQIAAVGVLIVAMFYLRIGKQPRSGSA